MWEHVASRSHKPEKIFPFGPNADEVMIYGTVSYGLKNGKSNEITWAARAHLFKDGADWKMDLYQVYLVRCTCTQESFQIGNSNANAMNRTPLHKVPVNSAYIERVIGSSAQLNEIEALLLDNSKPRCNLP